MVWSDAARRAAIEARRRKAKRRSRVGTIPRDRYTGKSFLLYHGTTQANAAKIAKEGLKPSGSAMWPTLTSSAKQAAGYANPDSPAVVKFKVKRSDVYKRGNKKAKLWRPIKHNVYGATANAYAPKTVMRPVK